MLFLPVIATFDAGDMKAVGAVPFVATLITDQGMIRVVAPCPGAGIIAPVADRDPVAVRRSGMILAQIARLLRGERGHGCCGCLIILFTGVGTLRAEYDRNGVVWMKLHDYLLTGGLHRATAIIFVTGAVTLYYYSLICCRRNGLSNSVAKTKFMDRIKSRLERRLGPWGVFFKGFLKHPVMVGSIMPSSDITIKKMLEPVKWDECDLFVEYGPGVGTFCRPVLERMKPDATLIVIDLNEDFIDYLSKSIRDSRFYPIHGSAADVQKIIRELGHEKADYVLSGLPFSTLPDQLGPKIAKETYDVIRPGGAFLVYQFVKKARDFMTPHFDHIDSGYSLWNILPCHLFWGWKAK